MASAILAALGSAAILFGSVLALRQERLKLLIAYSTVAQIGYLFLMFPLAIGAHPWAADAWSGGLAAACGSATSWPRCRDRRGAMRRWRLRSPASD
jgi:formate hydrogenlyase subunit 3/multisubunit Na+/H+ antiporter MnhD subunit